MNVKCLPCEMRSIFHQGKDATPIFLIKIFSRIINFLPISIALAVGRIIGLTLYFDRNKRFTGFRNLKLVFPYKSNKELFSILRKSLSNFGMSVIESFISVKVINRGYVDLSDINKIRPEGGGIITGIHSGSWEIYNAAFARDNKLAIIVQEQKNKAINKFLNEQRRRNNIAVCIGLKSLIRRLKDDYWIGIVIDAGAESNALYIDFFGNLVPMPQGAVYLARKFNKKIYPMFGYRKNYKFHYMEMGETLDCSGVSIPYALRKLNEIYEEFLVKHPDQYIWWYKRFKRKQNIRIVILSDGKTGHFKQSLSIKLILEELGYRVDDEIVEIRNLSRLRRFIIEIRAFFFSKSQLGDSRCLRFLLGRKVYDRLSKLFADIVISTGSSMAGINVILSYSLGAKSIAILKPNLPADKFSVVIVPEHDRLQGKNVVSIKGALSSLSDIDEDKDKLAKHFNLSPAPKISFFIGASLENKNYFKRNIKVFINKFKNLSNSNNFGVLVTTSRRTPRDIEELVKREFASFSHTEALIIANEHNYPFVAGGFIAASSIAFVTSDSISMISESLSAEITTVCVKLEEILDNHHINFMSSMKDILNFSEFPYNMKGFKNPSYSVFDYNHRVVKEAVKSIL